MGYPAVTYTPSNGETSDVSKINTNFSDLVAGLSDGTKDLNVNNITGQGNLDVKGTATLGSAEADDISVKGSLAQTMAVKAATNVDIGDATNGLRTTYLEANNQTLGLAGTTSMVTSWKWYGPASAAVAANWSLVAIDTSGYHGYHSPYPDARIGVNPEPASAATNTWQMVYSNNRNQILLPTTDITYKLPCTSVAAGEIWSIINRSSHTVTVQGQDATTFCTMAGINHINAVALQAAASANTHWRMMFSPGTSQIRLDTNRATNQYGSTNTKIPRWVNNTTVGTDITYTDSATDGGSFTINRDGIYAMSLTMYRADGPEAIGISLNSTQLTTAIGSITVANRLIMTVSDTTTAHTVGVPTNCSVTVRLNAGDVIRAHTEGDSLANNDRNQFVICQIVAF